jgi:O-antigen/teichoic acid export membrane protein
MRDKFSLLTQSAGLRQSIFSLVGNTAATGISAVSLMLISRLLGPEKFGEFSVGFAIVLILLRVNDLGLNATILKFVGEKPDKNDILAINSFTLKIKFYATTIILGLAIISTPFLAKLLNFPNQNLLLFSIFFGIWTVYYEQLQSMLQALHLFGQAIVINVIQATIKFLAALSFYFFGIESTFVILNTYMFAPAVPILFSRYLLPDWFTFKLTKPSLELQSKIISMAKHTSIAFVSAGIIENIDILFVQKYLSSYETGLLGGVSRIALLFSLIAYSLGNVLNPRVARYKDKKDVNSYIKKALFLLVACIAAFLAFIPFGKLAILLTVGPEYLPGINILYILTAASFLAIAAVPFLALFYTFEASWYFSVSGILQLVIMIVGNAVFVPLYGLEAAAWTRLSTRLFLFIFTCLVALHQYKKRYPRHQI